MKKLLILISAVLITVGANAESLVSVTGEVDADIWYDAQTGDAYNSQSIAIEFTAEVSEDVSVSAALLSETSVPPAGAGSPEDRFPEVYFDGAWIDWATPVEGLSLTIGDIVSEQGAFNYYLYAASASVISPELFIRGGMATYEVGDLTISALVGMLDDSKGSRAGGTVLGYNINDDISAEISGVVTDAGGDNIINTGVSLFSSFGALEVKADFGLMMDGDESGFNFLIEPFIEFGSYSLAAAIYYKSDEEAIMDFVPEEEFFIYIEPGITINDMFALGLPIEYHDFILDMDDDEQLWFVPTIYVYPYENVEWWLWTQIAKPLTDGLDTELYFGSEIIFSF